MNRKYIAVIAVVILVLAGAGVYAHNHKSSTPATNSTSSSSSPYGNTQSSSSSSSAQPSSSSQIIATKTNSTVGAYLVDNQGRTLYIYGLDKSGVSNCSGSCLSIWPAYVASSSSASLPANVATITRSGGVVQYTYKGMPLYTFASESAGQVTGDGVNNFSVAKP